MRRAAGWVYDNNRDWDILRDPGCNETTREAAGKRIFGRGFQLAGWIVPAGIGAKSVFSKATLAEGVLTEAEEEVIAYRAIRPEYADSTWTIGRFYRSGAAGRLGNDGVYLNSTLKGSIEEFQFHNPGIKPAVFEVKFPAGPSLTIDPPSGYFNSPLPFTSDVNILEAPSLRSSGAVNYLIRSDPVILRRVQ